MRNGEVLDHTLKQKRERKQKRELMGYDKMKNNKQKYIDKIQENNSIFVKVNKTKK